MNSNAEKGWRATLDAWFDSKLLNVHTSFPAVITAINDNNTVDVLPLIKTKLSDGSQKLYSDIPDVRLQLLSAKRGSTLISLPVDVGDNVWVYVSERDIVNVMESDGTSSQDSSTLTTHDLSDCFCIPAFHPDDNLIPTDRDNIVIKNESTTITVKSNEVLIDTINYTVNATDIQMTSSTFNVDSSTFTHNGEDVGDTHKHSGVESGGSNTGEPI